MAQSITKRQTWVDYARGLAIILVVYRHVFEGIKNTGIPVDRYMFLEYFNIIFFSFRMPLFFIVSGIFLAASFAKRGLARYIDVKARTILFPYFLWGALQITLQIIFSNYANSDRTFYDYLYLLYQPKAIEQFWYLYALFNVSVLYVIVKYVFKFRMWHQLLLGVGMFYLASFVYRNNINIGFVSDILNYYIFIVIGDLIHKAMREPENIVRFQSPRITMYLLVPFLASQLYFLMANLQHPEVLKYRFVEHYQPALFLLIALTGCAFIISICFLLQRADKPRWLRTTGTHSLHIYVAHVIAFASVRAFLINVLHITNVPFLLLSGIISGLFIPILLYNLAVRVNMEWIFALKERPAEIKSKSELTVSNAAVIR